MLACIGMALTYIAMARLPITQAQTLAFLSPLIVAPLAMWRLREAVSLRIALGLLLGFTGAALTVGLSMEAGPTAFWGALAGIGGAVVVALIQVQVRAMTATETTLAIAVSFTLIVTLVTLPTALLGDWVWPTGSGVWALLGAGVFGAGNLILFAGSLARAPASTVAPLDYTGLVWALLIDWLIFAQIPGPWGILGSVLITLAALLVVLAPRAAVPRAPAA